MIGGMSNFKDNLRQTAQSIDCRLNRHMRNQRISGCHRKQRRAKRRCIRQNQRYSKQSGGILSKLRDRRGNKADDDQRYTERNNLPKNIIQRHNEIHKTFICYKTGNNTDRYTQRQPKRQAFHQLAHTHFSFLIPISSFLLFPKFFSDTDRRPSSPGSRLSPSSYLPCRSRRTSGPRSLTRSPRLSLFQKFIHHKREEILTFEWDLPTGFSPKWNKTRL